MLQKVYCVYWYIKILEKFESTKKPTFGQLWDNPTTKYSLDGTTKVPYNIYYVQLQQYQICNFDEVVFEPNGIQLHPVIYPEDRRKKKTISMKMAQMMLLKCCTTRKCERTERFITSKFTPPHVYTVLATMWDEYEIDVSRKFITNF